MECYVDHREVRILVVGLNTCTTYSLSAEYIGHQLQSYQGSSWLGSSTQLQNCNHLFSKTMKEFTT